MGLIGRTMIRQAVTTEKNNFFRIAYGPQAGALLVMSASEAYTVDVEVSWTSLVAPQRLCGT